MKASSLLHYEQTYQLLNQPGARLALRWMASDGWWKEVACFGGGELGAS